MPTHYSNFRYLVQRNLCNCHISRGFASLSLHVNYKEIKTSAEELQKKFEKHGKVWDVLLLESQYSGRLLKQALVRFYEGSYTPAITPDGIPTLPPPETKEIEALKDVLNKAITSTDNSILNGAKLRVRLSDDNNPMQLHEWFEHQQENMNSYHKRINLFPVNPFHEPAKLGDDYRRGFLIGYKLGQKDGSQQ